MRLCGRMCPTSITRMTPDALPGHDESAATGTAANPHASTSRGQATTRCIGQRGAGSAAAADDAYACGLVGLALGDRLPAAPRTAVGAGGASLDQGHAAGLGPGVPR